VWGQLREEDLAGFMWIVEENVGNIMWRNDDGTMKPTLCEHNYFWGCLNQEMNWLEARKGGGHYNLPKEGNFEGPKCRNDLWWSNFRSNLAFDILGKKIWCNFQNCLLCNVLCLWHLALLYGTSLSGGNLSKFKSRTNKSKVEIWLGRNVIHVTVISLLVFSSK
jgi:hypothetical protein